MKSKAGKIWLLLLPVVVWLSLAGPTVAEGVAPTPGKPQILEFDRKFCPICAKSEMVIKAVTEEFPGQFMVHKMYIDEQVHLFRRYNVAIVPTQVMIDAGGREVFRHEGAYPSPAALSEKLRELGFIHKSAAAPSP